MTAWLPPGIKDPGGIPQGTHLAQVLDIQGFTSKKNGDYFVRIYFQCSTGEAGPISLRFFANDLLKTWINTRNQSLMNLLLQVANQLPPDGKEPDWPKVLAGLKDRTFRITVKARDVNASPYLAGLDLYLPEIDGPEGEDVELDDPSSSLPVPSPPQKKGSRFAHTPRNSQRRFPEAEDLEFGD